MNLLFRLGKNDEYFSSLEEAIDFFKDVLPNRDKNYFFHTKIMRQLKRGDIIYFSYDGFIIAKAIFQEEEINKDKNRDEKFIYGHKVGDIQTINSSSKLNSNIIKGQDMIYIKNKTIQDEIDRVLEGAKK
jgi:hypothetical protein